MLFRPSEAFAVLFLLFYNCPRRLGKSAGLAHSILTSPPGMLGVERRLLPRATDPANYVTVENVSGSLAERCLSSSRFTDRAPDATVGESR